MRPVSGFHFLAGSVLLLMVQTSCSHMPQYSLLPNKFFPAKEKQISTDNFHGYYKIGDPYEIEGKWYYPKVQNDYDEYGIASWYGPEFHGKKTANGDTFDQNALTAAHKTLPLPSMVRVTNVENGKTLIVMVNDRGPFSRGRIIDLSKRASEVLGFKDKGVARVRVEYLDGHTRRLLADLPKGNYPENKGHSQLTHNPTDLLTVSDASAASSSYKPFSVSSQRAKPSKRRTVNYTPHSGGKYDHISIPEVRNVSEEDAEIINQAQLDGNPGTVNEWNDANLPEINIEESAFADKAVPNDAPDFTVKTPPAKTTVNNSTTQPLVTSSVSAAQNDLDMEVEYIEDNPQQEAQQAIIQQRENKRTTLTQKTIQHYIQAGIYGVKSNASRVERNLLPLGNVVINPITAGNRTLYRVRLGPLNDEHNAKLALKRVIRLGHSDAMLVSDWSMQPKN